LSCCNSLVVLVAFVVTNRLVVILCTCWLLLGGCDTSSEADLDGANLIRPTDCELSSMDSPTWKSQSDDTVEIRASKPGLDADAAAVEVMQLLKERVTQYLLQHYPELNGPARLRLVGLAGGVASKDEWLEGENCLTWSTAAVDHATVANEVVFLYLNESFAREIPRYRQLGTDPSKSNEQRSGYLTTALLMLESIDSRYLAQTMAVNYERELIQSKLDELTETSEADFVVLLERGMKSTNVDAATRSRASLEKFDSIDAQVVANGLGGIDALIAELETQGVRAEIDRIRDNGLDGDYQQAEAAAELLTPLTAGREVEYAEAAILALNQRALSLRTAEIETIIDDPGTSVAELEGVVDQIDGFTERFGDTPRLNASKAELMSQLKLIAEVQGFAQRGECAKILAVTSFTEFDFVQTGSTSSKRNRRLNIEGTRSSITLTNRLVSPIQITGFTQLIGGAEGPVIVRSSGAAPFAEVAGGEMREFEVPLVFDNEHPAAVDCLAPLPKRTHECKLNVVTTVNVEALQDCTAVEISITEPVSLMSQHKPDTYNIKLLRDQ
jgi:hypothetical protein